ncbi:hypothetical protein E2320_018901, partial [Naja naja]
TTSWNPSNASKNNIQNLEGEVAKLPKEKEDLVLNLQMTKKEVTQVKLSEHLQKHLQELEVEISELKKKLKEQCKLLKMKKSSEQTISKLHQEIQALKNRRWGFEAATSQMKDWLVNEVEVLVSIKEAQHHLYDLLDDRKTLAKEIALLKEKQEAGEVLPSKYRRHMFSYQSLEIQADQEFGDRNGTQ